MSSSGGKNTPRASAQQVWERPPPSQLHPKFSVLSHCALISSSRALTAFWNTLVLPPPCDRYFFTKNLTSDCLPGLPHV